MIFNVNKTLNCKNESVKLKILNLFIILYLISMMLIFSVNDRINLLIPEVIVSILGGIIFFYKNKKIPYFSYLIFLSSFIIRLIIIVIINTAPVSDFVILYEAAKQTAQGNFNFDMENYFITWAYQTGFVLFEALFLKIINSIWILKIINCLLGAGITILIYKITLLLYKDEKVAQLTSIIYEFFPFHVIHITVLTNSHVSAFFFYLGLYLLLKHMEDNENKWFIAIGVCFAMGNIMRPEGIIFITSVMIFYFIKTYIHFNKIEIKKYLKQLTIILVIYFIVLNIADASVRFSGINSNGLKNNDPLWKFVLCTNYISGGAYSDNDGTLILEKQKEYNIDRKEAELYIIKERLESKIKLFDLMLNKINHFWWDSAFGWSYNSDSYAKTKATIERINTSLFWLVLILSMFVIFKVKRIVYENIGILLFMIIVFITFTVYLLIEVQPRYAYLVQIAIFIQAGCGIKYINDKIRT